VVRVGVGVHYVEGLQTVLEDEVEHRLDHLQLGVNDRGLAGLPVGENVAEASARHPELLEDVPRVLLAGLYRPPFVLRRHETSSSRRPAPLGGILPPSRHRRGNRDGRRPGYLLKMWTAPPSPTSPETEEVRRGRIVRER
jgi:hypothetical protein